MSTQTTGAEEIAWDLSDLYESAEDPRLEKDIEAALEEAKAFRERHHGKVDALDAKELGAAVSELEELASRVQRAFAFARLIYSTDTSDEARGALLQKLQERATALQTELLFFELEWINLDDEKAERILADPAVERYRHYLESKRRYRPYVLTEPEEKILSEKSVSGSDAWARLFTELISVLEIVIDGEKISFEEALSRMENPDREVRRKAAEGITTALSGGLRTRSFILNTVLLDKSTDDRLRRYPSWVSSRNLANEASDESVQALVDAVVSRYDIPQRYYALKARLLGLDRLADYDRLARRLRPAGSHLHLTEIRPLGGGEAGGVERLQRLFGGSGGDHSQVLRTKMDRRPGASGEGAGRLLYRAHSGRAPLRASQLHR